MLDKSTKSKGEWGCGSDQHGGGPGNLQDCQVWVEKLKKLVAKKGDGMALDEAKEMIVRATTKTKALKDETKEILQQANKAGSAKSTKSKK